MTVYNNYTIPYKSSKCAVIKAIMINLLLIFQIL